jgi:hypothetical protein
MRPRCSAIFDAIIYRSQFGETGYNVVLFKVEDAPPMKSLELNEIQRERQQAVFDERLKRRRNLSEFQGCKDFPLWRPVVEFGGRYRRAGEGGRGPRDQRSNAF